LAASLTGGNYLEGTAGEAGQNIHVEHGASIHVKFGSSTVEFATGAGGDTSLYGANGVELVAGENDVDAAALAILNATRGNDYSAPGNYERLQTNTDEYFTGTIAYGKQILTLNAGLVDLEYSSFGAWAVEFMASGTMETGGKKYDNDAYRQILYTPFSGGDSDKLRSPAANAAFTGKAMAIAQDDMSDPLDVKEAFFTGNAALTVNGAGTGGNLALNFPNFYDIGFTLTVSGSGFQAPAGSTPTVTSNGTNTSGVVLGNVRHASSSPEYDDTYLIGNFYGSGTDASEATGRFNVDTDKGYVRGSFGVK
jgi:hypothetical protein